MVYGKQSMRVDANLSQTQDRTNGSVGVSNNFRARIIGIIGVVLLAANSTFGEFIVQPIILRQQVRPGRQVPLKLQLENISTDAAEMVSLRLAELTQDADGVWTEVLVDDPNNPVDVSSLRSCKSWLRFDVKSAELDPHQILPVHLVAQVPAGTRGFYFAALLAQTEARETDLEGITSMMSVQYLVPIILEAQSTPVAAQVKLTGVGLKYQPATVENPIPAVIASLDIENTGGTYSRLQGQIRIWRQVRGRWQKTVDLTLPDNGIIPGVKLNLKQDIGIVLPDGRYKVEGYLYVDGKRGNGWDEEIDFKGDPRNPIPPQLVPIDLDKDNLFIDVLPGAARGGMLQVGNASEEQIKVNVEVILPEHMLNIINGQGIRGEDIGCADWITAQPSEFTMKGYRRQPLNLVVRAPAALTHANYYAAARLHITYPDGTSGGMRTVPICVRNGRTPGQNVIREKSMQFAKASPSRFVTIASFGNDGVTHVTPRCKGILSGQLDAPLKQFLMYSEAQGQQGILTPFETRTFSGVLDVSDIPNGTYRLTAILEYTGRDAKNQPFAEDTQSQLVVEVYDGENGSKALRYSDWDRAPDGKREKVRIQL